MEEHLEDIGKTGGIAISAHETTPTVVPVTGKERTSLETERDKANIRLKELREQANFGGNTHADQQLIASQEDKLNRLEGRLTAPTPESSAGLRQGIGRRVLSTLKALVGRP